MAERTRDNRQIGLNGTNLVRKYHTQMIKVVIAAILESIIYLVSINVRC